MGLTVTELENMDVGQIVVDVNGVEWQQDKHGRWDGDRGRLWASALIKHWGPVRRKESHVEQPMPTASTGAAMHRLAHDVINERARIGFERYGQPLQAMNGRDAVRDTIEELADGLAYALQIREERRLLHEELLGLMGYVHEDPAATTDGAATLVWTILNRYFPKES